MKVEKRKLKNKVWEFFVGKTLVATTTQFGKKVTFFSLTWDIDGLLKVGRKRSMEGVLSTSQYYPAFGFFVNCTKSDSKFSSKYIKKTILENIKDYKKRRVLFV